MLVLVILTMLASCAEKAVTSAPAAPTAPETSTTTPTPTPTTTSAPTPMQESAFTVSGQWKAEELIESTWETPPGPLGEGTGPWIEHLYATTTYHGTFEGTALWESVFVYLKDLEDFTGADDFTGEGTVNFTGKVDGKEGTFVADLTIFNVYGLWFKATYTIVSGTGELANLRGSYEVDNISQHHWAGTPHNASPYSGTCWFKE